ncbi:MAG: hypothetical protein OXB87_00390 [Hyphomicrobiales bacterium]|nr:hypothetical protein [Hyphomicrobiales bacterium]
MTNPFCTRNLALGAVLALMLAIQGGTLWSSAVSLRNIAPALWASDSAPAMTSLAADPAITQ